MYQGPYSSTLDNRLIRTIWIQRRDVGGERVSERTIPSSQENKREGRSAFRFTRFCYSNLTIKVILIKRLFVAQSWKEGSFVLSEYGCFFLFLPKLDNIIGTEHCSEKTSVKIMVMLMIWVSCLDYFEELTSEEVEIVDIC